MSLSQWSLLCAVITCVLNGTAIIHLNVMLMRHTRDWHHEFKHHEPESVAALGFGHQIIDPAREDD